MILLLDNYDSFTYNLVHLVKSVASNIKIEVLKNDEITLSEVKKYERILLSPGPGIPSEAGIMPELVKEYAGKIPILGVCLGHQCIAEVFGGRLVNMSQVCHGLAIETKIVDEKETLFSGVKSPFLSGRYHSWMVEEKSLPKSIKVTAKDPEERIMALSHTELNVKGVQFHPESILTEFGKEIISNWLTEC